MSDGTPERRPRLTRRRRSGAFLIPLGFFALLAVVLQFVVQTGSPERPTETAEIGVLADPNRVYDPVRADEPLPRGFRQLLRRDAILPVYDPVFVAGSASSWPGDTLVLGLEIDGESKAYPIGFLNRREMVIDRVAGIPVLVTW